MPPTPTPTRSVRPGALIALTGVALMGPACVLVLLRAPHGWKVMAMAAFMQVFGLVTAVQEESQQLRPPPRLPVDAR